MSSKNCSRKTERGEKRGDGGEAVLAATRGGKKGGRFEGRKKLGAVERICARRSHLRSHAMRVSTRGKDRRRRRRSTMESNWHPSTATAMRTCQTRRRSRAICRRQTWHHCFVPFTAEIMESVGEHYRRNWLRRGLSIEIRQGCPAR